MPTKYFNEYVNNKWMTNSVINAKLTFCTPNSYYTEINSIKIKNKIYRIPPDVHIYYSSCYEHLKISFDNVQKLNQWLSVKGLKPCNKKIFRIMNIFNYLSKRLNKK